MDQQQKHWQARPSPLNYIYYGGEANLTFRYLWQGSLILYLHWSVSVSLETGSIMQHLHVTRT